MMTKFHLAVTKFHSNRKKKKLESSSVATTLRFGWNLDSERRLLRLPHAVEKKNFGSAARSAANGRRKN